MKKYSFRLENNSQLRLDAFVAAECGISRSMAAKLIEDGAVLLDGAAVLKKLKPTAGSLVEVSVPEPEVYTAVPQDIPIDIVFEDDQLLVVNKSKGMVVHPAAGNADGTLVNAVLWHCGSSLSGINGVMRPGILHRIDKNTSGLLVIAKNDLSHRFLAEQIKEHSFTREYEAVVYGNLPADSGTIDAPVGRNPNKRKQMSVNADGREAVTHYEVIERLNGFTHLRLRLETGRTHQIRVHMAYIGHPVAGDDVYGPKHVITSLHGQCLHARKLGFIHPVSHEYMEFDSQLPEYFTEFLKGCTV